jgi:hypothetical protein
MIGWVFLVQFEWVVILVTGWGQILGRARMSQLAVIAR